MSVAYWAVEPCKGGFGANHALPDPSSVPTQMAVNTGLRPVVDVVGTAEDRAGGTPGPGHGKGLNTVSTQVVARQPVRVVGGGYSTSDAAADRDAVAIADQDQSSGVGVGVPKTTTRLSVESPVLTMSCLELTGARTASPGRR